MKSVQEVYFSNLHTLFYKLQSAVLLLLEGLLFTQNFMGVPFVYNIPYCGDLQISTSMNMIFLKNCFKLLLQFTSINFSSNHSEFFNSGRLGDFCFYKS